jgi:methionyl-tRNA synthetase
MIGSVLSADVFARYLRLKGDEVVFVSGSDSHGTPVAVAANKANTPVEEFALKNHESIKDLFEKWNISYNNYTITHNPTHIEFVQDFYLDVQKNGYIFDKEIESLYCSHDDLYLPDRFVEGICPHCSASGARGDQCDNPECGKLLTPLELKDPECAICRNTPIVKTTRHWYMNFPKLQDRLQELIDKNEIIPANARTMCLNSIAEGLPERAITRDLKWGIPSKFKGSEGKSIYVWFEAVLGYVSAVKEWAEKIKNQPEKYDYFWKDQDTKTVFFIGKDNIIFHLIVFPGILMAYNDDKPEGQKFVLPYNVSSTEFLMYENDKFSKSRGVGIWIDDALELAPLDYWRFNLIYNRPEKADTSFLWSEFDNNIKILNDVIGNFIHRSLTFIIKQFNGKIPKKLEFDDIDKEFLSKISSIGKDVGNSLENFELRKALRDVVKFAREGNVYLNDKAPWHLIKQNKDAAGQVFNICAQAVYALAILLGPFTPSTSERILNYLNIKQDLNELGWNSISTESLVVDHKIKKPEPLFQKLEIKELQDKLNKIRGIKTEKIEEKEMITYEEFKKLDIRVALIENAEKVEGTDNLFKLKIDIGTENRILVAGVAKFYSENELIGKKIVVLANLEPKKMKGILSQGMLLAAEDGKVVSVLTPDKDKDVSPGAKVL